MKKAVSTKLKLKNMESAIASNLTRMQTERHRLLSRLNRARSIVRKLNSEYDSYIYFSNEADDRLIDQYEAFINDLEIYIEHYEYEISKVKRGLTDIRLLRDSKAKQSFLNYIVDDTTRTIANLRIANSEYKEILAILPAEGFDQP